MSSGGSTPYCLGEGFRSETLAQYVFSGFGPCVPVHRADYGFDLLCNLSEPHGKSLRIKSSYAIQVKSEGPYDPFSFDGPHLKDWLSNLEFPFLLVVVSKKLSEVTVYSTWNIRRFFLNFVTSDQSSFPEEIKFIPDNDDTLKSPSELGIVPIGKPILKFSVIDLGDMEKRNLYRNILTEWIEMDRRNYSFKNIGLATCLGYIKWETNVSETQVQRIFTKDYGFSQERTKSARNVFME